MKLLNAQNCSHSLKQIKNNSVYCLHLDQWVAVNYCQYGCLNYEHQEIDPSTIPPETNDADSTGPVRDEDGKEIDITSEDEAHW